MFKSPKIGSALFCIIQDTERLKTQVGCCLVYFKYSFSLWFFSGYCGFFPEVKNMHIRKTLNCLICHQVMSLGVCVTGCICIVLTDRPPVQNAPSSHTLNSGDSNHWTGFSHLFTTGFGSSAEQRKEDLASCLTASHWKTCINYFWSFWGFLS